MKRIALFFAILAALCIFTMGVLAAEITVKVNDAQDISEAVAGAQNGDFVKVTLVSDIELDQTIVIERVITVSIDFNGYTVSYSGSAGKDSTVAGFHLNKAGATLSLNGNNPLADYAAYTHYGKSVKADMVGSGTLVSV